MVFLDTNILLELILPDRPGLVRVQKYLQSVTQETAISMLTVHLVMHFGRKAQLDELVLQALLAQNTILELAPADYAWAVENEQGTDFEDALQIAVALRGGAAEFVTLDRRLAARYKEVGVKIVKLRRGND